MMVVVTITAAVTRILSFSVWFHVACCKFTCFQQKIIQRMEKVGSSKLGYPATRVHGISSSRTVILTMYSVCSVFPITHPPTRKSRVVAKHIDCDEHLIHNNMKNTDTLERYTVESQCNLLNSQYRPESFQGIWPVCSLCSVSLCQVTSLVV